MPAEIHRFHPVPCSLANIESSLEMLSRAGQATCSQDGFWSADKHDDWSIGRIAANKRALALLARSPMFTAIIRSFPFIEGIAISGSLSKYHAGTDADIDYFIITRANRLWIARSLLHLFKKLTFAFGYQHFFCMNYFVDIEALSMTDQNIYTAIELVTLIPVYNEGLIKQMKKENTWLSAHLPNDPANHDLAYLVPQEREWMKKILEVLINLIWPEKANIFLMKLTDRKWRKKWARKGFPMEDYHRAFHTSIHVSKNHPADFQKQVLYALETLTGPGSNVS
jgi:hypothetical protein